MRRHMSTPTEELRITFVDSLAVDRTMMANERTGLAFIRTALGMVLGGLAMFRFFEQQKHDFYELIGVLAIASAVVLAAVGLRNFRHNAREYGRLYEPDGRVGK